MTKYIDDVITLRRAIHQNPELSGEEKKTSALVQKELTRLGIEFRAGYSGYGVVARICGRHAESRLVALRADMDALPITEDTKLEFASRNKGVMHACGHDVHTACLLGAARALWKERANWDGTVLLVFQPSEEHYGSGADVMLKEKVFSAFGGGGSLLPQRMYGMHVDPDLAVGTFGFRSGQYMASTDEIYITVEGEGGHAALPDKTTDSVLAACTLRVELQKIKHPVLPSILAFGRIIGEGQTNIIPDKVEMAGTIRTFDQQWRVDVHKQIATVAKQVAATFKAKIKVHIDKGYPPLYNNPAVTDIAHNIAKSLVGSRNVKNLALRLTAEDFAFFAQKIPSCFFRLGTGKSKGRLHSSHFTIDEEALTFGVQIMTLLGMEG
jgi:amidohydrolase